MTHPAPDPIIAVATAPGKGAVGVVRVSGTGLDAFVKELLGRDLKPRHATYLPLHDGQGEVLDQGLALYFPAPHSFTGEDVFEFQAHGGSVLLQMIIARCLEVAQSLDPSTQQAVLPRLRLAQAGEFTQRAFLNDKMDLAEAEAVADLIDAATEQAVKSAARSMSGEFSNTVHQLLSQLVQLRMLVEACLDFPDEDIDFLEAAQAHTKLEALLTQVQHVLQSAQQGAILRDGLKVVIAGQPNAGKSSLLNALAGAELAIVTPIAGTTRDKIEQSIQINGVALHVTDTAGLRESSDVVEQMGVARAWDALAQADIVLFLHDLPRWLGLAPDEARPSGETYAEADQRIAQTLQAHRPTGRGPAVLHVWNKTDAVLQTEAKLPADASMVEMHPSDQPQERSDYHLLLSASTGHGLPQLREQLLQLAGWQAVPEGLLMARQRHVQALQAAQQALVTAQLHLQSPNPALDLLAEELRQAQQALSAITGEFTADDLLGVIFSQFCIGK